MIAPKDGKKIEVSNFHGLDRDGTMFILERYSGDVIYSSNVILKGNVIANGPIGLFQLNLDTNSLYNNRVKSIRFTSDDGPKWVMIRKFSTPLSQALSSYINDDLNDAKSKLTEAISML